MELQPRVLLVALVLTFVKGALVSSPYLLTESFVGQGYSPAEIGFYYALIGLVGTIVDPLILFLVMLVLGRKLDMGTHYWGAMASLIVGSMAGFYTGALAAYAYYILVLGINAPLVVVFLGLFAVQSSIESVLAGFAALALSYFVARPKEHAAPVQG